MKNMFYAGVYLELDLIIDLLHLWIRIESTKIFAFNVFLYNKCCLNSEIKQHKKINCVFESFHLK